MMIKHLIYGIIGYLIGSISFSLIIGKVVFNQDIRNIGSGNLGGTNASRAFGSKIGILIIALDVLKCFLPMYICSKYIDSNLALSLGIMIPFGHCYPIFANFKGGKAVASSWGFIWATVYFSLLRFIMVLIIPLLVMIAIMKLSKYVSLGSILGFLFACIISWFFMPIKIIILYLILWLLIVYRHKENIIRIKNNTEPKITW